MTLKSSTQILNELGYEKIHDSDSMVSYINQTTKMAIEIYKDWGYVDFVDFANDRHIIHREVPIAIIQAISLKLEECGYHTAHQDDVKLNNDYVKSMADSLKEIKEISTNIYDQRKKTAS